MGYRLPRTNGAWVNVWVLQRICSCFSVRERTAGAAPRRRSQEAAEGDSEGNTPEWLERAPKGAGRAGGRCPRSAETRVRLLHPKIIQRSLFMPFV